MLQLHCLFFTLRVWFQSLTLVVVVVTINIMKKRGERQQFSVCVDEPNASRSRQSIWWVQFKSITLFDDTFYLLLLCLLFLFTFFLDKSINYPGISEATSPLYSYSYLHYLVVVVEVVFYTAMEQQGGCRMTSRILLAAVAVLDFNRWFFRLRFFIQSQNLLDGSPFLLTHNALLSGCFHNLLTLTSALIFYHFTVNFFSFVHSLNLFFTFTLTPPASTTTTRL